MEESTRHSWVYQFFIYSSTVLVAISSNPVCSLSIHLLFLWPSPAIQFVLYLFMYCICGHLQQSSLFFIYSCTVPLAISSNPVCSLSNHLVFLWPSPAVQFVLYLVKYCTCGHLQQSSLFFIYSSTVLVVISSNPVCSLSIHLLFLWPSPASKARPQLHDTAKPTTQLHVYPVNFGLPAL